jgi:hypothetical protein
MKGRSTLNILICIVLVGAFIWFQESWRAKNPAKALERVRLFNLDANTLISIEFKHTNGVVRCIKENGVWMSGDGEGNMGRADVALVHHMVSGLNSMGKGTTITSKHLEIRGLDAGEYGFSRPMIEITAVDNQGRHTWVIGRKAPLGNMVYAKNTDTDDIYTIPGQVLAVVPGSHDLLRDRVLFPWDAAGVRRVEIRGKAGFVQLVKDPQAGWRIQQPVAAQADPKEVEGFLERLYLFHIEDFIADNVSDFSVYGLQGETRQISIGSADGSSRMLVIGDEVPDRAGYVYVRRADDTSVFTLPADILQLLNVRVDDFRDANVLALSPDSVSSVKISRGEEQLALEMDDSRNWRITTPVVWNANAKAVEDLIMLWGNAVIMEFNVVTNALAPEWVFEFGSAEAGITNRVEVLAANGDKSGLLIKRDDDPAIYQINLPVIPDDFIDPLVYKNRQIWQLDIDGIDKITLLKDTPSRQVVERQEDRSFALIGTNGNVRVNEEAFGMLLNQLEQIEASEYITYNPRDLDIYGLANPYFELHVGLSGSNELGRVLLIGRETSDGFYSMVKGRDVIFYLEKQLVDILSIDLGDKQKPVALPSE